MFIVDFDDTLFKTGQFKQARKAALLAVGVSADMYDVTYQEARNSSDGLFTYSNERHADMLAKRRFDKQVVLEVLGSTTQELKKFLDEEAESFLKMLKKTSEPLVLLSLGDPSFQELKVKASGIAEYFERLFMVDESKEKIMRELITTNPEQKFWFINDKIEETKKVVQTFPFTQAVLKVSPQIPLEEYQNSGLPYFTSLLQIAAYVAKQS
jgi:hypothetical protein